MTIRAQGPDGQVFEFPDGTREDVISRTIRTHYANAEQQRLQALSPVDRLRLTPEYRRAYEHVRRVRESLHPRQRNLSSLITGGEGRESLQGGFSDFIDQTVGGLGLNDEMAGASAWLGQSTGNLVRQAQGQRAGLPASLVAQAAADYENERMARYAQRHPGLNVAAIVASIPAGGGTPAASAGRIGALRAGLSAAAIDAPFAVARQEGTLSERLPGAAREVATVGAGGTALTATANALIPRLTPQATRMASAFDQAGVDPSLATMQAGTFTGDRLTGPLTNTIADNPIAGAFVRPRMGRQLEQAADASRRIQGGYGQTLSAEGAGSAVQRGLRRYISDRTVPNPAPRADPRTVLTRDWSVPAQADAIFDHVLHPIQNNPTGLRRTVQAIQDVEALGAHDPAVLTFSQDPALSAVTSTVHELATRPGQPLTLRAARELRRRLRLRMDDVFAGGQDNASLQRIYRALTQDIYEAAGPVRADLVRADRFYEQRMRSINEALADFDPRSTDPSQAFNAIIRAADAGRGNLRALSALRGALRPAEMRTLAASLIDHMGRPAAGAGGTHAAELGFSVNTFSTNWRRMSPVARRILFGSSNNQLARELDNLATVATALKGVERTQNASGSGRYANIAATAGGAVANLPATATILGGMGLTGEALTNPAFVRWLVSATRGGATVGGLRRQLGTLAQLASRNPALAPFYNELSQRLGRQFADPASQPPARRELVQ